MVVKFASCARLAVMAQEASVKQLEEDALHDISMAQTYLERMQAHSDRQARQYHCRFYTTICLTPCAMIERKFEQTPASLKLTMNPFKRSCSNFLSMIVRADWICSICSSATRRASSGARISWTLIIATRPRRMEVLRTLIRPCSNFKRNMAMVETRALAATLNSVC